MSNPPDPLIGRVLGDRFEITEFIAAGGMGRVYRAIQRPLEREVAVKVIHSAGDNSERFQRRFYLEASLCARLTHPNVVRVFDYGWDEVANYFMAMEYLRGENLSQICKRKGPLEPRLAVNLVLQVCSALVEAHEEGLVHRDLKPSNLFVVTDRLGQEHVKILDFGVVKDLEADADITRAGVTLGSPLYIAPEQIEGENVDARSDLYSLGVTLFHLLAGRPPFTGRSAPDVLMQHLTRPAPSIASVNPGVTVSKALERFVRKSLSKNPDDRFQDAREFAGALARIAAEGAERSTTARPESVELVRARGDSGSDEATLTLDAEQAPTVGAGLGPHVDSDSTVGLASESVEEIRLQLQDGLVAYVDFNCPYCFALHERVVRWGLEDAIEWRVIEHSSHVLDGPFDFHQEQMLSTEVVEVHHRAPDVTLVLPQQRCRSTVATRLQTYVQREHPEKQHAFRRDVFRALWQDGLDIGEESALKALLDRHEVPDLFLQFCEQEPLELQAWQEEWEQADYDRSIPVLAHPESGRVLIGLPEERVLKEFMLGERSRVIDSAVCYYQQRPSILLWGWMSRIWQVLDDVRTCCELLQVLTVEAVEQHLSQIASPDLIIVENSQVSRAELEVVVSLARRRNIPLVVSTREPDPDEEIELLSMGVLEYLPATGDGRVARARLSRVLRDRYNLERVQQESMMDPLTGLPSRAQLLEHLRGEWERGILRASPLSFLLFDLDAFKPFNKTHGYLSGNEALVQIGRALSRAATSPGAQVARFSGNEFAVLLPDTARPEAERMGQQLHDAVVGLQLGKAGSPSGDYLTATMGIHSLQPSENDSLFDLIDGASEEIKTRRAEYRSNTEALT